MKTYFIRHTSALDVDTATIEKLWLEDRIAIHYPHDNVQSFHCGDSKSLIPSDYSGRAKGAVRRLNALASKGGYVFATYRGKPGGKIGYVEPGQEVELVYGAWGNKNGHAGREAVLKSIKLTKVLNLSPSEALSFTAVQPRQGTFCEWRKIGTCVEARVQGKTDIGLENLTPTLQEVMCMEYLRTEDAELHGLPRIAYTLSPVGRTMKDIDIHGVTESGLVVAAQVTFKSVDADKRKFKRLDTYLDESSATIYFCNCDAHEVINGHHVFPLKTVFDEFCTKRESGKLWLERAVMG